MKTKINNLNVFIGKDSLLKYLNPENHITPLVELSEFLNPFYQDGVRIYAKLLNFLPLLNVKQIPAYNMLKVLKKKGKIKNVSTIVEASSGNTVLSLAVIGRLLGIKKTISLSSNEVSVSKLRMLRLFNVHVVINEEPICPDPEDKNSSIYKAKEMAKKKGYINPGQYDNNDNPRAHKKITGSQIFKQLNGDIQIFCAGLGTTGTLIGTSSYLRSKIKNIKIIGVVRKPNNPIPGVRTKNLLRLIAFNWEKYVDYVEEVSTYESYLRSLEMMRYGIVVGPSSGFALAGLLNFLNKEKERGNLDKYRNKKGLINAVFICCDTPLPYIDDYFKVLGEKYFPKVKNKELLLTKDNLEELNIKALSQTTNYNFKNIEIDTEKIISEFYKDNIETIINKLKNGEENNFLKENCIIFDIRTEAEFKDFHLPDSINIYYNEFLSKNEEIIKRFNLLNKKVLLVCNFGLKSFVIANILKNKGINAFSLKGGTAEWSSLNLPRWKPNYCYKD